MIHQGCGGNLTKLIGLRRGYYCGKCKNVVYDQSATGSTARIIRKAIKEGGKEAK